MGIATEPQFHVLAVDDSLIDRKLIERLLKSSSYQVTTVDSGCKALEFLGSQENPLDSQQEVLEVNLIITDYCMPGMTGYDLLKKVKESSSLRNIPVVIMSSENVPSRITRCLEEGAEEFFLKPVRLADVNRLRHHMLRTKYELQQQNLDTVLEDCQKSDRKPDDEPKQQPHEKVLEPQTEMKQQMQQEQPPPPLPVTPQQNNTKRKSMEDGLSPDRTRPRYNGLTTVN